MIKEIKKGAVIALSFSVTLGLIGITYAAWVNVSTVNTDDTLTASMMNDIINNQKDLDTRVSGVSIPSGAVMAFNLASCPTGWSKANGTDNSLDLRGEFIRGWADDGSIDAGRTLASWQNATRVIKDYWGDGGWHGAVPDIMEFAASDFEDQERVYEGMRHVGGTALSYPQIVNNVGHKGYADAMRVRPRNVALLYCVKD